MYQFIKFGIVGLSNTIISYVLYVGVIFILNPFGLKWDFFVANIVSFVLSVLWSFYWNNKYVFKVESNNERIWWKTLIKTYLSYALTGLVLNNVFFLGFD